MSRSSARLATKQVIKREVIEPDEKPSPKKSATGIKTGGKVWNDVREATVVSVLPPDDFMEEDEEPIASGIDHSRDMSESTTENKTLSNPHSKQTVQSLTPLSPIEKKRPRLASPDKNQKGNKNRASIPPNELPVPSSSRLIERDEAVEMEMPEPTRLVIETRDELNAARKKLENVLTQITRNEIERQTGLESGSEFDLHDFDANGSSLNRHRRSGQSSKSKTGKSFRKQETSDEDFVKQPTLVLKLFDRSVDLAKFTAGKTSSSVEIPLYPVCREWMRNGKPVEDALSSSSLSDKRTGPGLYHLPRPLPLPEEDKKRDPRIPKDVRRPRMTVEEMDAAMNSVDVSEIPRLFAKSLEDWKVIRSNWREAARQNELRYKHSCDVLRAMFEKSLAGGQHPESLLEPKVEPIDSF